MNNNGGRSSTASDSEEEYEEEYEEEALDFSEHSTWIVGRSPWIGVFLVLLK